MAMYFDIINISKGKLKGNITIHLYAGQGKGYMYHTIPVNGVLESVPKEQISDQIRGLTRSRKGRPPVIKLVEIDYEARQSKLNKELELLNARAEKKRKKKETLDSNNKKEEKVPDKKEKKKELKKSKKVDKVDDDKPSPFSAEIVKALEEGKELPNDDNNSSES